MPPFPVIFERRIWLFFRCDCASLWEVEPFVRRSVRPSNSTSVCPQLFLNDEYGCFESEKSSIEIINNGIMSDDVVVASDVSPRCLFFSLSFFRFLFFFSFFFLSFSLCFSFSFYSSPFLWKKLRRNRHTLRRIFRARGPVHNASARPPPTSFSTIQYYY